MHPAHDLSVQLDHDCAWIEVKVLKKVRHGGRPGYPPGLPVHDDIQFVHGSPIHGSSRARVAAAGSAACHSARTAATPYAPTDLISHARAAVMPPIAITG